MSVERYRKTMSGDVLHSWAADAQIEIDQLTRELAEARAEIDRLKAGAVQDGWVMVPEEPEEDLISDALSEASVGLAWHEDTDTDFPRDFAMAFFRAMLAARPDPENPDVE